MPQSKPQVRSNAKWLWVIILFALLVVSIAWFADPLGDVEGTPTPEPTADPTEWTTAPETPGVEVKLPQTPLKNRPAENTARPDE